MPTKQLPITKKAPPKVERPVCRTCGEPLTPRYGVVSDHKDSYYAREWDGYEGVAELFCTKTCAIYWARTFCGTLESKGLPTALYSKGGVR